MNKLTKLRKEEIIELPEYISGPVSFYHYKIKGIDIYLFGNQYPIHDQACTNCTSIFKNEENCYTLSAFIYFVLQNLENTKENLDLYVEDSYSMILNEWYKVNYPDVNDGGLFEIIKLYRNAKSNNLRYHHIDARFYENYNLSDLTTKEFNHYIKNYYENSIDTFYNLIKEYVILCSISINIDVDLKRLIKKWKNKIGEDDRLNNLFIECIEEYKNKNYKGLKLHPIGKQFRKLLVQEGYKGNHAKRILNMVFFIIDMNKEQIDAVNNDLFNFLKNITDTQSARKKFAKIDYDIRITYQSILMDCYAIPRVLYNYENSMLKIIAVEENQSIKFSRFFDRYYPKTMISYISGQKTKMRCLHIS